MQTSDGGHIMCLHMALFYNYYRDIIEKGHLYIACPPLYKISKGDKVLKYCYTDAELKKETIPKNADVSRYKGLGEMRADELWDTAMNPETRKLIKVTIEDAESAAQAMDLCMGADISARRDFLLGGEE